MQKIYYIETRKKNEKSQRLKKNEKTHYNVKKKKKKIKNNLTKSTNFSNSNFSQLVNKVSYLADSFFCYVFGIWVESFLVFQQKK